MKSRNQWIAYAFVGAASIGFLPALSAQQPQATPVNVVQVREAEVPQTVTLVGSTYPVKRSAIASEMAGLVETIPVEAGDHVEKNQLIGRLRDTQQRLLVQQAEATLDELQARLDELVAGTREEEKARAQELMEEARAVYEKWKLELERINRLRQQNSASDKEFNDAKWDTAAAKARLGQATAAHELAQKGPRQEEIARARHAVAAQKAVVEQLKYDLSRMEIRAPFDGDVVSKHTEIGQWLAAGGQLVEMIDVSKVKVIVDVPEAIVSASRPGESVFIEVEALKRSYDSRITRLVPDADRQARTFPIEIVLDNEDQALKSGMFVRTRVPSGPKIRSSIVPRDAIIQRSGSYLVVMIGPAMGGPGEMGYPTPVRLGAVIGDWVSVEAAQLQPGAKVAIKGHDRIFGPVMVKPIPVEFALPEDVNVTETQPATADGEKTDVSADQRAGANQRTGQTGGHAKTEAPGPVAKGE